MPAANTLVGTTIPSAERLGNVNAVEESPARSDRGDGTELFAALLVVGALATLVFFRVLGFQAVVGIQVGK